MMLNVLLYFYLTGTHSPRDIARSLETNVALRFLAARNWPSHHAICGFRARDLPDIRTVFVDLLRMTQLAGLARMGQHEQEHGNVPPSDCAGTGALVKEG